MATSNQKTLVVGDMHLKEELILGRVDAAVSQMDIERVVFCGDYTDEWHSNRLTTLDALDMLVAWVRRRRRQGMEIDLVLGNHDMQYRRRAPGPGTHVDLYDEVAVPEHDIDELATSPTNGSIGCRAINFSRIVHIQEDLDVIVPRLIESACKHFAPQGFVDVVHHNRLRTAPDGNEQHLLTALSVFIRH